MKIRTKFHVGDSVFVIYNNEIDALKVIGVNIEVFSNEDVVICYKLEITPPNEDGQGGFYFDRVEERCFRTIEKMIKFYTDKYGVVIIAS